jgi:hypothetical protein
MSKTDPKNKEAVRLAVETVIESSDDPNYISVSDVIELMGYKCPDTSMGESWGSLSHVTMPVSKVLADMGFIKANVRENGRSVVRWLKGQPKKDYLAKKGERAYRQERKDPTPRKRTSSRKRSSSQKVSPKRAEAGRLLRELRDMGYSNKELMEACGLGSGTVSRLVSPNPKYDYKNIEDRIYEKIVDLHKSLTGSRNKREVNGATVKPKSGALVKSEQQGIRLPKDILSSKDAAMVLRALVDSGQTIIIGPDK